MKRPEDKASDAYARWVDGAVRTMAIDALGWEAEGATDRYTASTGLLVAYVREDLGDEVAEEITAFEERELVEWRKSQSEWIWVGVES